ncbi:MAG TPA: hypothetical protein VHG52_14605 [Thermomicrobiales bacterium]|nr:hypothetical protein [Thermomicrobiales bacterium]
MIQVAIAGIDTGLGQAIASCVDMAPDMRLTGGTTVAEHYTGAAARLTTILDGATALIDLTSPREMMANAIDCLAANCALVGGAGRLDPNHVAELREFSSRIPIFYAPNLCLETAAVLRLLPLLRDSLPHLDAEITGLDHYRRRQQVPAVDSSLAEPIVFLTGSGQEIMLSQKVYGHDAPARGALQALRFLADRERGFFTMDDLLPLPPALSGQQDVARVM